MACEAEATSRQQNGLAARAATPQLAGQHRAPSHVIMRDGFIHCGRYAVSLPYVDMTGWQHGSVYIAMGYRFAAWQPAGNSAEGLRSRGAFGRHAQRALWPKRCFLRCSVIRSPEPPRNTLKQRYACSQCWTRTSRTCTKSLSCSLAIRSWLSCCLAPATSCLLLFSIAVTARLLACIVNIQTCRGRKVFLCQSHGKRFHLIKRCPLFLIQVSRSFDGFHNMPAPGSAIQHWRSV